VGRQRGRVSVAEDWRRKAASEGALGQGGVKKTGCGNFVSRGGCSPKRGGVILEWKGLYTKE